MKEAALKMSLVQSALSSLSPTPTSLNRGILNDLQHRVEAVLDEVKRIKEIKMVVYIWQRNEIRTRLLNMVDDIPFLLLSLNVNRTAEIHNRIDKLMDADWNNIESNNSLRQQLQHELSQQRELRRMIRDHELTIVHLQRMGLESEQDLEEIIRQSVAERTRLEADHNDAKARQEAFLMTQLIEALACQQQHPAEPASRSNIPLCPITLEPIEDPVIPDCSRQCNGSVSKLAFQQWIQTKRQEGTIKPLCPCCGDDSLRSLKAGPNVMLAHMIEQLNVSPHDSVWRPLDASASNALSPQATSDTTATSPTSTDYSSIEQLKMSPHEIVWHPPLAAHLSSWSGNESQPPKQVPPPKVFCSPCGTSNILSPQATSDTTETAPTQMYELKDTLQLHTQCLETIDESGTFAAGTAAFIQIWHTAGGSHCKRTILNSSLLGCLKVFDNGRKILTATNGLFQIFDVNSGKCEKTVCFRSSIFDSRFISPISFDISEDGGTIVCGGLLKSVQVWDVASRKLERTLPTDSSHCAFFKNSQRVVSACQSKLQICDAYTCTNEQKLKGHLGSIECIGVFGNGIHVVSGSHDKTLRIWNVEAGMCEKILAGHRKCVQCLKLFDNDKQIVSGSRDKTLKVWSVDTGLCMYTLTGHSNVILSCAVTNNGNTIVSSSKDKTTRVWTLCNVY